MVRSHPRQGRVPKLPRPNLLILQEANKDAAATDEMLKTDLSPTPSVVPAAFVLKRERDHPEPCSARPRAEKFAAGDERDYPELYSARSRAEQFAAGAEEPSLDSPRLVMLSSASSAPPTIQQAPRKTTRKRKPESKSKPSKLIKVSEHDVVQIHDRGFFDNFEVMGHQRLQDWRADRVSTTTCYVCVGTTRMPRHPHPARSPSST